MRDPALLAACLIAMLAIQFLLWLIARQTDDLPWWGACVLSFATIFAASFLPALGIEGKNLAACYLGSAIIVWILSDLLYELERWKQIALILICPVIGMASLVAGFAVRKAVFGF